MVGDAAMAFDPLSSHGMTTCMYMAEKACDAITQYFSGDKDGLDEYAEKMTSIYNTYLNELVQHYNVEQRWEHCAFWQSKQNIQMSEDAIYVS